MRINYNISSIIARNALNNNDNRLSDSIERLSSGLKINSAADDAAGLAISMKMDSQIRCLDKANKNANDGISVVNTADGAMQEAHAILQRMNELAVQAANGTNSDGDREQIQLEVDQLVQELDRIADTTQFNAQNLLDGTFAYKGFTNTENVKVMSYSEGVAVGTYAIKQLQYYHYEDSIKDRDSHLKGSATGTITHERRFEGVSPDDVKDALVTDATADSGLKSFPEGCKVLFDEENITITGENDFAVTLTLNDRNAVANSGVTTTKEESMIATDNYRNIKLYDANNNIKYNISELNFVSETDAAGNVTETIYTSSEEAGLRGLDEDFSKLFLADFGDVEVHVTACDVDVANNSVSITAEDVNGNVKNYTFEIMDDPDSTETFTDKRDYYLHSHTDTKKTLYTVGDLNDDTQNVLLNLTGVGGMRLQVGANEGQIIEIEIPSVQAVYLGVDGLDLTTQDKATAAIDLVGNAINKLSTARSRIGAYANRIEHTITNLNTTEENMTAAYSRIMDVDMAKEMTEYSTVQVLVESATAMLAQANERPQSVLQLLQ